MIRLVGQSDDHDTDGEARNVLGEPLETCCTSPMTGFYRNGRCDACASDPGLHVVCAEVTEAFLAFSRERGNDLTTPVPEHGFPGLRPGDRWCLCAARWAEALDAGVAPPVHLEATHEAALGLIPLEELRKHAAER